MVLVGVGLAAAGLLVQRLVVPQAHGVDAEQLGGGLAEAGVERERPDVGAVLPQVHALDERLLVAALLGERAVVARGAGRTPAVTAAPYRSTSSSVSRSGTTTKPSRRKRSTSSSSSSVS